MNTNPRGLAAVTEAASVKDKSETTSLPRLKNKYRVLDAAALAAYAAAVLTAVAHHEPWSDEAQAWLIARDMPLRQMMLSELHYEVSPGLWHMLLWVSQRLIHLPYSALNWMGALFAIAGAALLIFAAPFPRIVRYLMASSYFVLYQYAVIARPYVLLLLCGAAAAIFYRRGRPIQLAASLAVMSGISLQGTILAAAIASGYAWHCFLEWETLDSRSRKLCMIALAIVCAAFAMVAVIAHPRPDISAFGHHLYGGGISKLIITLTDITIEPWEAGAVLLAVLAAFAWWRRELLVFSLACGGLLFFQARIYGAPHHEGTIVIAIIIVLWIAWPEPKEPMPRWFNPVSVAVLCTLFGLQTLWAASAWRHDYQLPYSGARDAAAYLKRMGAVPSRTVGTGYGMTAVEAYFDQKLFANWKTTYLHHSRSYEEGIDQLDLRPLPEYVVLILWHEGSEPDPTPQMQQSGYKLVHVSPGHVFFKQRYWVTQTYLIYHRER